MSTALLFPGLPDSSVSEDLRDRGLGLVVTVAQSLRLDWHPMKPATEALADDEGRGYGEAAEDEPPPTDAADPEDRLCLGFRPTGRNPLSGSGVG